MLRKSSKDGRGFTIIELLLSLAITALLLAAVAYAFSASVMNYRENEEIFQTVNKGRQALYRMTTELRTAEAVDPNLVTTECSLITAGGADYTYRYNSGDRKLYLITNDDPTDADYVLCDNVTAMTFVKSTFVEESVTYVKDVQISMTVQSGDFARTLSAAAVVRRNL
jgi:prepilin-type N-terminal cleavage/methylation domain-containing protein